MNGRYATLDVPTCENGSARKTARKAVSAALRRKSRKAPGIGHRSWMSRAAPAPARLTGRRRRSPLRSGGSVTRPRRPPCYRTCSRYRGQGREVMRPYRLTRRFKAHFGETPREQMLRVRLERVRQLLSVTDTPRPDIALDCGVSSQFHRTTAFGKHIGASPGRCWSLTRADRSGGIDRSASRHEADPSACSA